MWLALFPGLLYLQNLKMIKKSIAILLINCLNSSFYNLELVNMQIGWHDS